MSPPRSALPLEPAELVFGPEPGDPPRSLRHGDLYHPRIGAAAQARHVFLQGNGLPARWAGQGDFTVLETGFGLGSNFLATWQAWRDDPQRCQRLHHVAVERHPVVLSDLARAHLGGAWPALAAALQAAWPAPTPGLHSLDFEQGRVRLLLVLGDAAERLPGLRLQAQAFYLDGFAPRCNPEMWQPRVLKALGRLAAPGATLATWSVARALHEGLRSAGFEPRTAPGIGGKREITLAAYQPRFQPRRLPDAAVPTQRAVVVGAGLAGAAVAQALASLGLSVTVLDSAAQPASKASGNPAGLFHGTVSADDGPHARLFRAAAETARRSYAAAIEAGVPGSVDGFLRLAARGETPTDLQARLQHLGLPPAYVQALPADGASARAGVALPAPAWFYPGGGWISPAAWVRQALTSPGITVQLACEVLALGRDGGDWCVLDASGQPLARAPLLVLASAESTAALLQDLPAPPWPLQRSRGQVSFGGPAAGCLRLPVAGDGYAIPLPDGGLLFGATRQADDEDPRVRDADHRHNLERLQRLTGAALQPQADAPESLLRGLQGRVGWRLQTTDRLPLAGPMPIWPVPQGQRADQPRLLPRHRGLFVLTALGARGLSLAPLLGRLVAAQATGTPWPLEQDLADAVDPARWVVRKARQAGKDQKAAGPGPA